MHVAGRKSKAWPVVAAILAGLIIVPVAALCIFLHSPLPARIASALASEYLEADVAVGRLQFSVLRSFPDICAGVEELSVTMEAERYAPFRVLPLQEEGTAGAFAGDAGIAGSEEGAGAAPDTLLRLGRLELRVRALSLLKGVVDVRSLKLEGLRAFAHSFSDSLANWMIFKPSADSTERSGAGFPEIRLREFELGGGSLAVFTSAPHNLRFSIPLELRVRGAGARPDGEGILAWADSLSARLAHLPLEASGKVRTRGEGLYLDARAAVKECPIQPVLDEWAVQFFPIVTDISTDASLSLDAFAEGLLAEGKVPRFNLNLSVPDERFAFRPYRLDGTLGLECRASADDEGRIKAMIDRLFASVPGARVQLSGRADGIEGSDPRVRAHLGAGASAKKLCDYFLVPGGSTASGNVNVNLDIDAHKSSFAKYHFHEAGVKGSVSSDKLTLNMPMDTMSVELFSPLVRIGAGPDGIAMGIDLDSSFVHSPSLAARLRESHSLARLHRVEAYGKTVPGLELLSDNGRLFVKAGEQRAGVSGARVTATLRKRVMPDTSFFRKRGILRPDFRALSSDSLRAFRDRDIRINIDSSFAAMMRRWAPTAELSFQRGFIASPSIPLRTRLRGFSGNYDGRNFRLDTLALSCGTSDLEAKGELRSVMRVFSKRRSFVDATLSLRSSRLNVNEIVAAMDYASAGGVNTADAGEDDSFVLDSIPDATARIKRKTIVVPGNISAALELDVDRLDFENLELSPFRGSVNIRNNTLQVLDFYTDTGFGQIGMDAYYSSRSPQEISGGLTADLYDVQVHDLLTVLPMVDSLMPALHSFSGLLDCHTSANMNFDEAMNVITPSMQGVLEIKGRGLNIDDAGTLRKITSMLLFKNKDIGRIDDLSVSMVVRDNKAEIFPFLLGVDRYRFALQGIQGFNGSLDYHISVLKSPLVIPFGINIRGAVGDWRFALARARYRNGQIPVYTKELQAVDINFARAIQDIYHLGVEGVRRYNGASMQQQFGGGPVKGGQSDELLSYSEYNKLEAKQIESEIENERAALEAEINALLKTY